MYGNYKVLVMFKGTWSIKMRDDLGNSNLKMHNKIVDIEVILTYIQCL